MAQKKIVYAANASLYNRQWKNANKLSFNFLFAEDIGTRNWKRLTFKMTGRYRDYKNSIMDADQDFTWSGHEQTQDWYLKQAQTNRDNLYIGKGYLHKDVKRLFYTTATLLYKPAEDTYEFGVRIANPQTGFDFQEQFELAAQENKNYSHRCDWKTNQKFSAGARMPTEW